VKITKSLSATPFQVVFAINLLYIRSEQEKMKGRKQEPQIQHLPQLTVSQEMTHDLSFTYCDILPLSVGNS